MTQSVAQFVVAPADRAFLPFTRPTIDEPTIAAVAEVLRSGWLTSGPKVRLLEETLSQRYGGRPVRVANSATAALEMALLIAGVGQRAGLPRVAAAEPDEVITTPLSWVATANVVLAVGARPVFVDIDPVTRNIDLARIEAAITPRTKAIMPVDLAGLPVDRAALYAIANRHGLRVIEDAAQSMGAHADGAEIGARGDLISFSFHPNKNITSGEGGCLVMNTDDEARLFEKLRLQGVTRFADGGMDVDLLGGKSNMTDVSAVIALGQLPHLDAFNARRRQLAARYFASIDSAWGLQLPPLDGFNARLVSNWHMFQPLLPLDRLPINRGDFITAMREQGIGIGVHYPAIHLFALYRTLGYRPGDFPVAERVGASTVSLPLFPAMQDADVDRVVDALRQVFAG